MNSVPLQACGRRPSGPTAALRAGGSLSGVYLFGFTLRLLCLSPEACGYATAFTSGAVQGGLDLTGGLHRARSTLSGGRCVVRSEAPSPAGMRVDARVAPQPGAAVTGSFQHLWFMTRGLNGGFAAGYGNRFLLVVLAAWGSPGCAWLHPWCGMSVG